MTIDTIDIGPIEEMDLDLFLQGHHPTLYLGPRAKVLPQNAPPTTKGGREAFAKGMSDE